MKESSMKKSVLINGNRIKNKYDLFPYLEQVFKLSQPMGHNLDALWDTLSHTKTLNKITIIHSNQLMNNLGDYAQSLLDVFNTLKTKRNIELIIYRGKRNETN